MDVDAIRRFFEPAIRRVLHFRWRFSRGLTVGVRGLVFDAQGRVFLVKHSYVAGWHLPGGGVEHGESLATALGRELREEGNIELLGPAELYGIYWNRRTAWRDHVDALPEGTTVSTRARIAEVLGGRDAPEIW
jgi:ADP-ribose pyrophosphatase YjhB (NUDIX family)